MARGEKLLRAKDDPDVLDDIEHAVYGDDGEAGDPAGTTPLARYQFRLMVGGHVGPDYSRPILTDKATGKPRADRRRPSRMYEASEVVWENRDLAKLFNRPRSIKFQLVKDWGPEAYTDGVDPDAGREGDRPKRKEEPWVDPDVPQRSELEAMSLGELRELAAKEEVVVPAGADKAEIVAAILGQRDRLDSRAGG